MQVYFGRDRSDFKCMRNCTEPLLRPVILNNYRISSNNRPSDYFYFRTRRGRLFEGRRLFEGGDYFKYFSQEVVPYIFCFVIPSNKEKSEIHEYYHRKNCKNRCFCYHLVVNSYGGGPHESRILAG